MNWERVLELGEDIRNSVFETLDAEPEMTGMDAGRVAKATEQAFLKSMEHECETREYQEQE